LKNSAAPSLELPPLLGEAPAFLEMLAHVSRIAPLDRPVLIVGERGTGKELIAARLNFLSARWEKPFVQVNCGALAESLLDSELFGHEAGAFTGAVRRRLSRFEIADGGTLFLDEIANASLAVQEKILRVIEYGTFERVGGNEQQRVDVRILAATNIDLPHLAATGKFRADLLDRLAFDVVTLPPLRHRREDIPLLAAHFAQRMMRELKRDYFPGFTPEAEASLLAHPWPGNVRELRNAVERSVARAARPDRPVGEIAFDASPPPSALPRRRCRSPRILRRKPAVSPQRSRPSKPACCTRRCSAIASTRNRRLRISASPTTSSGIFCASMGCSRGRKRQWEDRRGNYSRIAQQTPIGSPARTAACCKCGRIQVTKPSQAVCRKERGPFCHHCKERSDEAIAVHCSVITRKWVEARACREEEPKWVEPY
jgi:psp operon transcriptional activator